MCLDWAFALFTLCYLCELILTFRRRQRVSIPKVADYHLYADTNFLPDRVVPGEPYGRRTTKPACWSCNCVKGGYPPRNARQLLQILSQEANFELGDDGFMRRPNDAAASPSSPAAARSSNAPAAASSSPADPASLSAAPSSSSAAAAAAASSCTTGPSAPPARDAAPVAAFRRGAALIPPPADDASVGEGGRGPRHPCLLLHGSPEADVTALPRGVIAERGKPDLFITMTCAEAEHGDRFRTRYLLARQRGTARASSPLAATAEASFVINRRVVVLEERRGLASPRTARYEPFSATIDEEWNDVLHCGAAALLLKIEESELLLHEDAQLSDPVCTQIGVRLRDEGADFGGGGG